MNLIIEYSPDAPDDPVYVSVLEADILPSKMQWVGIVTPSSRLRGRLIYINPRSGSKLLQVGQVVPIYNYYTHNADLRYRILSEEDSAQYFKDHFAELMG